MLTRLMSDLAYVVRFAGQVALGVLLGAVLLWLLFAVL